MAKATGNITIDELEKRVPELKGKIVDIDDEGPKKSITLAVASDGTLEPYEGLAQGTAIYRSRDMGVRYGLDPYFQAINMPDDDDFYGKVKLCRELYIREPIVATTVDLMVDFSSSGMEHEGSDQKALDYFDKLCKYSDMDKVHKWMFFEYFMSSEVFMIRGNKKTVTSGTDVGATWFPYTVLNPIYVELVGQKIFDEDILAFRPQKPLSSLTSGRNKPRWVSLMKNLEPDIKKAVEEGKLIILNKDYASRISRKRQPYQEFAIPYLTRIFEPCLIKRRMREADMATAESIRNVLVTITCGDDEHPADKNDLIKLAQLFKNPAKSMELVWNHTLDVEYKWPPSDLLSNTKYEQVNADILDGLGIPSVLIGGGNINFAAAYVSLLGFVERLNAARTAVARWQEAEYRKIIELYNLKFTDVPSVKFKTINLRDERTFKNILLAMRDRGLIDDKTLLTEAGYDFETVMRNIEKEMKDGTAKKIQAFSETVVPPGQNQPNKKDESNNSEKGTEERKTQTKGPKKRGSEGRPKATVNEGNYTKRARVPSVKGETTNASENPRQLNLEFDEEQTKENKDG